MTAPAAPGARPPATRAEALTLLRKVDYDLAILSPEAIAAIRAAFHLPREGGP
jgi:hypothetical protein